MKYATIVALLCAIALALVAILLMITPIPCGMCGARVHDVWQVRGQAGFVDVCQLCYQDMRG